MISRKYFNSLLRTGFALFFLVSGMLVTISPALGQSPLSMAGKLSASPNAAASAADAPDRLTPDDLRLRQKEIANEISAYETSKVPDGITTGERTRQLRVLTFIAFNYQNHLNALTRQIEIRRLSAEADRERTEWAGFTEPPPYSIRMVDGLNSELQRRMLDKQTADAQIKIIEGRIQAARNALKKTSEAMRLAQEKVERSGQNVSEAERWRLAQVKLDERSAITYLSALVAAREAAQSDQEEAEKSVRFAAKKLKLAEAQVAFNTDDLASLLARIEEKQTQTLASLASANSDLDAATKQADESAKRLDSARSGITTTQSSLTQARASLQAAEAEAELAKKSAGLLDKINPFSGTSIRNQIKKLQQQVGVLETRLKLAREDLTRLDRESALASARQRNATIVSDLANNRLALLEVERAFWEMRYAAHQAGPGVSDKRRLLAERSQEMLTVLAPRARQLRSDLDANVSQILSEQESVANPSDARDALFHGQILAMLTAREHAYRQSVSEIGDLQQMLQRVVAEDASRKANMSPTERLSHWWEVIRDGAQTAWRFEIFTVEDTIEVDGRKITGSRGITVGKILQSILLVVIGYFVINLLTKLLIGLAARRLKIDPMEANIAHKWIMTAATVILALMAMELLKIPLAAFAFLGGAIAIGAGFGMQTLLKNLISGLMLLLERPFKIRDVVEVGGIRGEITDINIRSCTIRSVTGIETLVPNSTFLEQNVTNWTLSSQLVRYTVKVGVAYGVDVDEVARLLREVAEKHSGVQRDPIPEVIFEDFGDNALVFSLNVWLNIGQNQVPSRVVLSELRFMISHCFAERGIGIPYPQHDVHLDTSAPLSVRVVQDQPADSTPHPTAV